MEGTVPTKPKAWFLASRPKTLPAAVMPVLIGSAVAFHDSAFTPGPALAALFCALLIQIGTNFANDLLDFKAGMDTEQRLGPERAVANQWISEQEMFWGTVTAFGLTVPVGLYLIWIAGWPVLAIGLCSIAAGIAYTGGPYPLAYNGLGDLFVFIFFGLVATVGTYYVQALQITTLSVLVAIPAGALITNILVVNNYRDIKTDRETGKNTLAVIIGHSGSRMEYLILLFLSYVVPVFLLFVYDFSLFILLPLLSLPIAVKNLRTLYSDTCGKALNPLLERTAQFSLIFGILFSIGLLL